jgi:hypothetical protein
MLRLLETMLGWINNGTLKYVCFPVIPTGNITAHRTFCPFILVTVPFMSQTPVTKKIVSFLFYLTPLRQKDTLQAEHEKLLLPPCS